MILVVLGGGIDLNGKLPQHVYTRLDKALELYKKFPDAQIALSGKYSFLYGKDKPKVTEAEKMAEYLVQNNVPKQSILLEKNSQDTISNAYYLKKEIFLPQGEKEASIISSNFHIVRIKYIFTKVFGTKYHFNYIGTEEHLSKSQLELLVKRQKELLTKSKAFLQDMKEGDHEFLKGKFFKDTYYTEERPAWVKQFVAHGK